MYSWVWLLSFNMGCSIHIHSHCSVVFDCVNKLLFIHSALISVGLSPDFCHYECTTTNILTRVFGARIQISAGHIPGSGVTESWERAIFVDWFIHFCFSRCSFPNVAYHQNSHPQRIRIAVVQRPCQHVIYSSPFQPFLQGVVVSHGGICIFLFSVFFSPYPPVLQYIHPQLELRVWGDGGG